MITFDLNSIPIIIYIAAALSAISLCFCFWASLSNEKIAHVVTKIEKCKLEDELGITKSNITLLVEECLGTASEKPNKTVLRKYRKLFRAERDLMRAIKTAKKRSKR